MEHTEIFYGTLDKFVYKNHENGFSVCTIMLENNQLITVRGILSHFHEGEMVRIQGSWTTHPKFGKQFEVDHCTAQAPTSVIGLKKYLGSGLIKGIGPAYAEKLVDAFGLQVLDVIDKYPEKLHGIPGLGPKRVVTIMTAWQDQKEISQILLFLKEKEISTAYALKIYKRYGKRSLAVVTQNPYQLAQDIWGIGFTIADAIAANIGIAPDSPQRVQAGILYAIRSAVDVGHLYVELDAIKKEVMRLLNLQPDHAPLIKQALHDLHGQKTIVLITYQNVHYITQTYYYQMEKTIADIVKCRLNSGTTEFHTIQMQISHQNNVQQLSDDQLRGVTMSLQHPMTIITGGPGTGKTTLIKTLLHVLDTHKIVYKVAAPTGRAAKRITESTKKQATTIHRLLEFDAHTMKFTRNEKNPLQVHMLIVDEASMIDIFLAHALLKALPRHAHIVLLGDVDQLPSVGAGNFLHDLIASGIVPCARLTQIFRQAQTSLIVTNAHRINNGQFPIADSQREKPDYLFIEEKEPESLSKHMHFVYTNLLPTYNIALDNSITLVPMRRGIVGSETLNQYIQNMINADSTVVIERNGHQLRVGDRVMQIRNNYDKNVFNGDMGYIEQINMHENSLVVRFAEQQVEYEQSELDELVLAYAISIHKSQGSEFDAVIVPLYMSHFTLLQRNLLYTAITRAKKLCIFIGQKQAIGMAVTNNTQKKRCTFLHVLLTEKVICR